jgi:hypothetical protein
LRAVPVSLIALVVALLACSAYAQAPSYSTLYNPLQVQNLYLTMNSTDWNTIKNDSSFTTEVPAYFNATAESKILVAVRRKPTGIVYNKVALKIDMNEYFDQQTWHGVKKISLENGEAASVLAEGMAWYLHGVAAEHVNKKGFNYRPGKFTFANVHVNGANQGMYVHVEQPDKQFLRNRDMWVNEKTWLYKQQQVNVQELHEGSTTPSPTRQTLNYYPFEFYGSPMPSDSVLATQLPQYINMDAWLTMGAVNAFTGNGDMLFSKGKNFFMVDYEQNTTMKRQYVPWDLDAVFPGSGVTRSIYAGSGGGGSGYVDMVFDIPAFRSRYNGIMLDLLNGPLSVANLTGYLNQLEPIAPGAGSYASLKDWVTRRHANIMAEVQADWAGTSSSIVPEPSSSTVILLAGSAILARRRRARG